MRIVNVTEIAVRSMQTLEMDPPLVTYVWVKTGMAENVLLKMMLSLAINDKTNGILGQS